MDRLISKGYEMEIQERLQGRHVLLCEDHPLNAEITIKVLERVGCETVWAENGEEGVRLFTRSKINYFDVILMDERMPVMDGIEAAKAIRRLSREDALNVPIIAMTANIYGEDRDQVL